MKLKTVFQKLFSLMTSTGGDTVTVAPRSHETLKNFFKTLFSHDRPGVVHDPALPHELLKNFFKTLFSLWWGGSLLVIQDPTNLEHM